MDGGEHGVAEASVEGQKEESTQKLIEELQAKLAEAKERFKAQLAQREDEEAMMSDCSQKIPCQNLHLSMLQ